MNGNPTETGRSTFLSELFRPVDIASVALFRFFFGAIMLWETLRYYFYGHIEAWWIDPRFHATYLGFGWVQPWPGNGMHYHFAALALLALLIALGLFYRVAIVLFFLGFSYVFLLEKAQYLNHFYLVCLISFLLMFIPAQRGFSLDARWRRGMPGPHIPAWALWMLRIQIGIPYFYGGLAKLAGDWLAGEPLRTWLAQNTDFPLIGSLFTEEWVVYFFSYSGLIFDLVIVPLLIWRRTRLVAFFFAIFFHLTNSDLFDIGIFPWFMMVASTLYFHPSWPRMLWAKVRRIPMRPYQPDGECPSARVSLERRFIMGALAIYLAVQLLVPLRHHLYPGSITWNGQGYYISWHMKLTSYQGITRFFATDPDSGANWEVDPEEYLSQRQYHSLLGHPDIIVQASKLMAEDLRAKGHPRVEIRVQAEMSLNGRRPQWLINPEVDLAAQKRSLKPATWFMPLVVPLSEKIFFDPQALSRTQWASFQEGEWVIVEERFLSPDGSVGKRRKKQILSFIDEVRLHLTTFSEGDGKFDETGNTQPAELGKIPAALYMKVSGTRTEGMVIGERTLPCEVISYTMDDPVNGWKGRLDLWQTEDIEVPYRNLTVLGPSLALLEDVVKAVYQIEMEHQTGRFTSEITALNQLVSAGGQNLICMEETLHFDVTQDDKPISGLSRRWLSSAIPGHVAKMERQVRVDGVEHVEGMIVLDMRSGTGVGRTALEDSLVEALKRYYRGMASETPEEQVAAMNNMFPERADFSVLFPGQAEKVWRFMTPALVNLVKNTPEMARASSRIGEVHSIELIDVRKNDTTVQARAALALIPEDVPAFLAVTVRQNGSSWTGPFLFVNGRWIRIPGFENIPQYLSQNN